MDRFPSVSPKGTFVLFTDAHQASITVPGTQSALTHELNLDFNEWSVNYILSPPASTAFGRCPFSPSFPIKVVPPPGFKKSVMILKNRHVDPEG